MFMLIYFFGIASCGVQGAQKAKSNILSISHPSIIEFFSAFGGGLIRDIFILRVYPVAFTLECVPDIITALASGTFYLSPQKNKSIHKFLNKLTVVTDACGLGTFIAIGADKAISLGASPLIVLLCGITTSLGGGILSSMLCNISIKEVLCTNIMYRFSAIIGAIFYPLWVKSMGANIAHIAIIVYTFVTILVWNRNIRTHVAKVALYGSYPFLTDLFWVIVIMIKIPSHYAVRIKNTPETIKHYTMCLYMERNTILKLHRIRQM